MGGWWRREVVLVGEGGGGGGGGGGGRERELLGQPISWGSIEDLKVMVIHAELNFSIQ